MVDALGKFSGGVFVAVVAIEIRIADRFAIFLRAIYRKSIQEEAQECILPYFTRQVHGFHVVVVFIAGRRVAIVLVKRVDLIGQWLIGASVLIEKHHTIKRYAN